MEKCPYATETPIMIDEDICLGYYVMCEVSNKPCNMACGDGCEMFNKWLKEQND